MRHKSSRSFLAFVALLTIGMLAAACGGDDPAPTATATTAGPAATPTSAPPTSTPTPAKSAFEIQWEQLVADAKAEGEVNILLGGAASRLYGKVLDAFAEKYGIKVNALGGSTTTLTDRILAEREAGKFTQDVAMGGGALEARWLPAGALDPIAPLFILPEVLDKSLWANDQHWYRDLTNKFIFLYSGNVQIVQGGVWYNTNEVTGGAGQHHLDLGLPRSQVERQDRLGDTPSGRVHHG